MVRELAENNFLKDFRQEGEVWHWSVVFQDLGVKSSFLEERLHDSWFESKWEKAGVQRVRDDRCEVWKKIVKTMVRKDAGRGFSSQVFTVDWFSIFFTSSTETDGNAPQTVPQKGWSGTEGGVTVAETRLRQIEVILLWKKSEKRCGSSETGMYCWWPEYLQ